MVKNFYDDKGLEAAGHKDLVETVQHLRDRNKIGYDYLVTVAGRRREVRSTVTGKIVSFESFFDACQKELLTYVNEKLTR